MALELDSGATERLGQYIERLGRHLKDRRKRESFAIYASGILAEGERKSVEPIAARACRDPDQTRHMHDKLLHLSDSVSGATRRCGWRRRDMSAKR
jgi:SRSO17 transposase